ncbi:MAG TPA: hypothetical protein VD997_11995 [Phycisphaerales bacterium]|nr:hypothetical protein [Phycisphaerales bacterium]
MNRKNSIAWLLSVVGAAGLSSVASAALPVPMVPPCECAIGRLNYYSTMAINVDWVLNPGDSTPTGTAAGSCLAVAVGQFIVETGEPCPQSINEYGTNGDGDGGSVDLTQATLYLDANANTTGIVSGVPAYANLDIVAGLLGGHINSEHGWGVAFSDIYEYAQSECTDHIGYLFSQAMGAYTMNLSWNVDFGAYTVAPSVTTTISIGGGWSHHDYSTPVSQFPGSFIQPHRVNWFRLIPTFHDGNTSTTGAPIDGVIAVMPDGTLRRLGICTDSDFDPTEPTPGEFEIPGEHEIVTNVPSGTNGVTFEYQRVSFGAFTGDVNGDEYVCWSDLALLGAAVGAEIGEPSYDPRMDFDLDGEIEWSDYEALLALTKCIVDTDCDGATGTDQDIEAFFYALGSGGPQSDFNGDGASGTDQDIEAFFRVMGGGAC